jgi:RNA polymerase sigma-70 factor (ECF subfamily)
VTGVQTCALPISSVQEDVNKLHQALKRLPERYRLPITLRYLEGYDYNQIAGALGLTDGSLRGLLNRGMKMLRENIRIATTDKHG